MPQEEPVPQEEPGPEPAQPRRRRRWRRRLAAIVAVLLPLVWLAPPIVAHTGLFDWIADRLAADLKGELTVQSASLGWFSSVELSGVEVRDRQGQTVLEVPKLRTDKCLLAILWNRRRLGSVRLEEPTLKVVVHDDGSNVENVLASYLTPRREPRADVSLGLEIVDGKLSVRDAQSQQAWQIESLQLALAMPADGAEPLLVQASGVVAGQGQPGRLTVKLRMNRQVQEARTSGSEDVRVSGSQDAGASGGQDVRASGSRDAHASGGQDAGASGGQDILASIRGTGPGKQPDDPAATGPNELVIEAERVPLAMLDAVLRRYLPEIRTGGRLSSAFRCQWDGQGAGRQVVIHSSAAVEDLALAAPLLAEDQLQLQRLQATCQIAWQDRRLQVDQLIVQSDVGNASAVGTLDLGDASARPVFGWLPRQTFELGGQLDLARLAAVLPNTLRIREGTQVTSGQVKVAVGGRRGEEGMRWQAYVASSDLTAVNRGRQLVWRQPMQVTLAAREGPEGPIVEDLRCESDFLTLEAAGTPEQFTASARFDLNPLVGQLDGLVDLGGIRLAGSGWARFNWRRSPGQDFQATGGVQLQEFELGVPDRGHWTEDHLTVAFAATGRTDFAADSQVDTATLKLSAGPDQLEARLMRPVLDLRGGGVWPVEVRSTGELARWQARASPFLAFRDWHLAGSYELFAKATGSAGAIHVRQARLNVGQLRVEGPGLQVREPQAELIVSGAWDGDRRRLEMPSASLTSSSLRARASDVVCTLPPEGPPQLAGTIVYGGSLDRLGQWTTEPAQPPQWHFAGEFSGQAQIERSAGGTKAKFETTIDNLVATHRSGRQVHQEQVRLAGHGSYDDERRLVQLEQVQLDSDPLVVEAAGRVALGEDQVALQISGQADYDLESLSELAEAYFGRGVPVAGRGSSPFSYRGPLALGTGQGDAAVNWTGAEVYGFDVGPGQLQAGLSDGMLRIAPMDLAVSEGRVHLAPRLRLAPKPIELYVEPGRVAEQVRINPRMCDQALKYIAPVLAGVTTAEGRFSIDLDGCRVPLTDPAQGELAGRMTIHSVEVAPGPLVRELAVVLGRATPARIANESVVPFRLVDGRVYHRDLELVFADVTVRTYGSVGLDQSLAIMAEMPVPAKWQSGNRWLTAALKEQTIRVPVAGTLQKPRMDRRVLDQLSRQFLEDAARNVLEEGINRGLERLFGPSR